MAIPKFSIIIPIYNAEGYITDSIESVLFQSYSDYELILVDDGSTDKSGNICDFYAKRNSCIRVIHKKMEVCQVLEMPVWKWHEVNLFTLWMLMIK